MYNVLNNVFEFKCMYTAACAYLKTQYTCGSGPYEQLMKDHCKKTCEFCGKYKLKSTIVMCGSKPINRKL